MLPSWSIAGIAVLLLGLVVWVIRSYVSGDIVTRKDYDAVQKMSDQWQHAWEVSQQTQIELAEVIRTMTILADTLKHFLDSLPRGGDHDSS